MLELRKEQTFWSCLLTIVGHGLGSSGSREVETDEGPFFEQFTYTPDGFVSYVTYPVTGERACPDCGAPVSKDNPGGFIFGSTEVIALLMEDLNELGIELEFFSGRQLLGIDQESELAGAITLIETATNRPLADEVLKALA